jgi:hypothetical protein
LSDKDLKKDFAPIARTMPQVMKLKPASYHFKSGDKNQPLSFGFVAQEVGAIFPNLVTRMDDGHLALNYEGLIPVAVAAIQEQQKQIESRDAEIVPSPRRKSTLIPRASWSIPAATETARCSSSPVAVISGMSG